MKQKVIIYSEIKWNFLWQRHHEVAKYFLKKEHEVIFVEKVFSRFPPYKEILRRLFKKSIKETASLNLDKLKIKTSFFLPRINILFKFWNFIYWFLFWKRIQKNAIIYSFVDNPQIYGGIYRNRNKKQKIVFDVIHNWWNLPWHNEVHLKDCNTFIKSADKLITDSTLMYDFLSENKQLKKIHLMQPGVSSHWINQYKKIFQKDDIFKVIFFGNLRHNSDLEIFKLLASNNSIRIDIYGTVYEKANDLLNFSNIDFYGQVAPYEISKIINNYHFILLPYTKEIFNKTLIPNKYYECLATGKPLLSNSGLTHLPMWKEFSYTLDKKDILLQLERILKIHASKENDQLNFAKKNTWDARLLGMYEFILKE